MAISNDHVEGMGSDHGRTTAAHILETIDHDPRPFCGKCEARKVLCLDDPLSRPDARDVRPKWHCPSCEVHLIRLDDRMKDRVWFAVSASAADPFWAWVPNRMREIAAIFGYGANPREVRRAVAAIDGEIWCDDGYLALRASDANGIDQLRVALGAEDVATPAFANLISELLAGPSDPPVPSPLEPVKAQIHAPDQMMSKTMTTAPSAGRIVAYNIGDERIAPEAVDMLKAIFGDRLAWHTWRGHVVVRHEWLWVALVRSVVRRNVPDMMKDDMLLEAGGEA